MKNRFEKDVKDRFDWASVREECLKNLEPDEEGEGRVGRCFLGTVFALTPSGKYYLPFACSNLSPCPRCKGAGNTPNKQADPVAHANFQLQASQIRSRSIELYGPWCDGKWPKDVVAQLDELDATVKATAPTRECKRCNGCGSEEAYLDELWREAIEERAERFGLSIENGESDPCDIFAVVYVAEGELING